MLDSVYSVFNKIMESLWNNKRSRRITILILFAIYFLPFIFSNYVSKDYLLFFPPFGLLAFGLLMIDMHLFLTERGK